MKPSGVLNANASATAFFENSRGASTTPPSVRRKLKAAEARRKMSKMRRAKRRSPSA